MESDKLAPRRVVTDTGRGDTEPCPAHPLGRWHYVVTIGEQTFCMDCGKLYD
jgi:hypothetical protein